MPYDIEKHRAEVEADLNRAKYVRASFNEEIQESRKIIEEVRQLKQERMRHKHNQEAEIFYSNWLFLENA